MLDVQNLCKSFDKKPFLTELTFQVAAGECLVLLGRNGAGKTLLLNIRISNQTVWLNRHRAASLLRVLLLLQT